MGGRELALVVTGGGTSELLVLPAAGEVVLGRDPARASLVVAHPSLSRAHARFVVAEGKGARRVLLEDLGSKNGTRLGGIRLARGELVPLRVGAAVELGAVLVVLVAKAAPASRISLARRPSLREVLVTPKIAPLDDVLRKIAPTSLPVLLLGETGVGKDVLAERLHALSPRNRRPFVRVHAAAIAEGLVESELFGHEAGAFTGAIKKKIGLVEAAEGGTVFVDEVGELPLSVQVKLLRVLEDKRVQPVGATAAKKVDVRFVAATHRDLAEDVKNGSFRRDLRERLRGVTLVVPPLRERRDDIVPLAEAFLARVAPEKSLSAAARKALTRHPYFGNVRELKNVIERSALLAVGDTVDAADLLFGEAETSLPSEEPERARVRDALRRAHGNQRAAAELLGISRRTLIHRLDAFGLERPRKGVTGDPRPRS